MAVETQGTATTQIGTPTPNKKRTNEQKKKLRTMIKRIISWILVLAVLSGAGYAVWYFVFRENSNANLGEPIFDTAGLSSIIQTASISGTANAKDSASITLSQSGVVEELFISEGQMVYEGDPLFVVTSEAAELAVEAAKQGVETAKAAVTRAQESLNKAYESYNEQKKAIEKLQKEYDELDATRTDLIVTAPHAGQLQNVANIRVGDPLTMGTTVAQVVDNTKLKLSLYFSYAYENDIYVGQTATVTIPVVMKQLTGTVEKINKVKMITAEGGVNFEVVIVVENTGTLTQDMAASATMVATDGTPILPYADGSLTYYQTTTIATLADGPVSELADLMNYGEVTAGQVLLAQGTTNLEEKLRNKQEQINSAESALKETYGAAVTSAQESVETAQEGVTEAEKKLAEEEKNLSNFSAVAPITGMVTALPLYEGAEVTAGSTAVVISNNSVMTVNISIDDRNRQYVNVGDEIELNDWNGNYYVGVVDSIAVIGESQNGVTVYPGIVRVNNDMGTLMGGYWLSGSVTTASSIDCITVPISDVRYYSPEGSEEPTAVVYIQTDEEREGAIDPAELPASMREEIPAGCIVMPVEIGLSDNYFVEIISGVNEGDLIYNNTPKSDGSYSSWDY